MKEVWIVDDDRSIRWVLEKALQKAQIPCRTFSDAPSLLEELKIAEPSVILSDIRMPGMSGLEMLTQIKERHPKLPVIIMTAFSDLDSAVSSFQGGAFEYLPKPFDIEKAVELVRRAAEESGTESRDFVPQDTEMIGKASAMQDVFRAIGRLSQSKATVLLTGESGSGKEVVARALHKHSPRAKGPFIALNMAAIPRDLMESELFGHERGAFTGANTVRHGRFEQAEGGTLFLDEIGDMPAELQTRLLRVLSDGYYYRVGGHQPLKANVRIIAATHRNLEDMVREGRFREDLYHRLNVIRIKLPPLRDRKEDIPLLTHHFLKKSAENLGVENKIMTEEAMNLLQTFRFPGNVRQLENLCNWLVVMTPSQHIHAEDLPEEFHNRSENASANVLGNASANRSANVSSIAGASIDAPESAQLSMTAEGWQTLLSREVEASLKRGDGNVMKSFADDFERVVIEAALKHTRGKRVEAALRLGIGRNTITRKISELNLSEE